MTPCFKLEKEVLSRKRLGKACLGDPMVWATEKVMISVHVKQKEADSVSQIHLGLTDEKQ